MRGKASTDVLILNPDKLLKELPLGLSGISVIHQGVIIGALQISSGASSAQSPPMAKR